MRRKKIIVLTERFITDAEIHMSRILNEPTTTHETNLSAATHNGRAQGAQFVLNLLRATD